MDYFRNGYKFVSKQFRFNIKERRERVVRKYRIGLI